MRASFCLSVSQFLSVCLSVCLLACLPACLAVRLSICLSVCLCLSACFIITVALKHVVHIHNCMPGLQSTHVCNSLWCRDTSRYCIRPLLHACRLSKAEQEKTDKMLIKSLEREERERKRVRHAYHVT